MNRKLSLLIPAFALLAGWGIGRLVSRPVIATPSTAADTQAEATRSEPESKQSDGSDTLTRKVDALIEKIRTRNDLSSLKDVYAFAQTLQPGEFGPAIAQLSADKSLRSNYFMNPAELLAGYWMETDPTAALKWFKELSFELQGKYANGILGTWWAQNPKELLTWLEQLPNKEKKAFAIWSVAQNDKMDGADFERSLTLLKKAGLNEASSEGFDLFGYLFQSYAEKSPLDAAARALSLPGGGLRTEATKGVLSAWALSNPIAARTWVQEIADEALAAQVIPACAKAMAQKDPKAALDWVATLPDSLLNQEAMSNVLNIWAQENSKAALGWVDDFPEGANVDKYVGEIISSMAETDTELAFQTIVERVEAGLPVGTLPNRTVERGPFSEYARLVGATEALKLAESIPAKSSRELDMLYSTFVVNAAQSNFAEVSQWILDQKSGYRKSETMGRVALGLYSNDRDKAVKWIQSLPKHPDYDGARATIANNMFRSDADAAVKLYGEMVDTKLAQSRLKNRMEMWIRSDRTAAEAWLNKTSAFTSAEKTELLKKGAGK